MKRFILHILFWKEDPVKKVRICIPESNMSVKLQNPEIASNSAFFSVTKYVNESFHLSPLIHQMVIVDLKLQFIRQ